MKSLKETIKAVSRGETKQLMEAKNEKAAMEVLYDYSDDFYIIKLYKNGKEVGKKSGYPGMNGTLEEPMIALAKSKGVNPNDMVLYSVDDNMKRTGKVGALKNGRIAWDKKSMKEETDMNEAKDNDKDKDKEGTLDPVKKDQLKADSAEDREDDDIDNDGDTDDSDEYLHKRRKAISKALDNRKSKRDEDDDDEDEDDDD